MPVTSSSSAPYAPASAVVDVVSRYRSRGLPSPITDEVLGRVGISNSLIPRTLSALKILDLIDEQGNPTATFEGLRLAPEGEYQQRLAEWLNGVYADVLRFVDPATADEVAIRDAFRNYNPVGQQARMVTLFMGLYAHAGIGPEKPSRSRASGNGTTTSKRIIRGVSKPSSAPPSAPPPQPNSPVPEQPHKPAGHGHGKPLEYQLIDLLKRPRMGETQKAAVWTLVQFLSDDGPDGETS